MVENAERFGGDLTRISMIGESSGAGFVASLSLYLNGLARFPSSVVLPSIPRERPRAAVLHCGYFEVSDISRFDDDLRCHRVARTRIAQIRKNYLPFFHSGDPEEWKLANPRLVFRDLRLRGEKLPEGFPEFFIPVGENDPVIGDSERMAEEIALLGQPGRLRKYPGVGHAFYASPAGTQAKLCWKEIIEFLSRSSS
jgi:acetyl esterase/lipase